MAYNHATIRHYFNAFASKNLTVLSDLFADDVVLQDWEISAVGKQAVLAANKNIFDSVDSIQVNIINTAENPTATLMFVEIEVIINNDVKLNVVDIIRFNNVGKIIKISAYKQ
jgi:ketosteroid isomerase-like protein